MIKTTLLLFAVIIISLCHAQQAAQPGNINLTTFSQQQPRITQELQSLTSREFYTHPDYGILPANAPCKDCFELLQKRDEKHSYFVKEGTQGKEFYAQTSYSNINYRDVNGNMRAIDSRLKPTADAGIFSAPNQPFPITVNLRDKYVSLLNAGKELLMNHDVHLFIKNADGTMTSLGEPSWSNYTAGDNGVVIHNFYPGIDLEIQTGEGKMETFYRINKPLNLQGESLVIHDNVQLPAGFSYDYSYSEKKDNNLYDGALFINNAQGTNYFIIGYPAAYDENSSASDHTIGLSYGTANNNFDLYIPISWMNASTRSYPLVIDPFVSATSTLPQSSITGSGYSAACFANGCYYHLDAYVPPSCTITNMFYTFNYRALGTCNLNQGAWDMTVGTCKSPQSGGQYHTCTIALPGLCMMDSLSCYNDVLSCLPGKQLNSSSLPVNMTFYRCIQPGSGCGFSCINGDTPWKITVAGISDCSNAVTITASGSTSFCKGDSVTLTSSAGGSYSWSTGETTQSIKVFTSGYYTVYVNDSVTCGTQKVIVDSLPVAISNSPVCTGSPIFLSAISSTSYSWTGPNGFSSSIANPSVTATSSTVGTYSLTATNKCGTNSSTTTVVLATNYPNVNFSYVQSELDATFTNTSQNYTSSFWSFGDGSWSSINSPFHHYKQPGIYTVCLSAGNGCVDDTCKTLVFKGLASVKGDHGGNTGSVSVSITGGGFVQGMKLRLHKQGQTDFYGTSVIVRNIGLMTVDLDLTGKVLGAWDVVGEYPDGSTSSLPGAFTVEVGRNADLVVGISGGRNIRPGFDQTFYVKYTNLGNVDALFVPLLVSVQPVGATINIPGATLDVRKVAGFDTLVTSLDLSSPTLVDSVTNSSFRLMYIGKIAAGSFGQVGLTIHIPANTPLGSIAHIDAYLGFPLYASSGGTWTSNLNTTLGGCTNTIAENIAGMAVDAAHIQDWNNCVINPGSTLIQLIDRCKEASRYPLDNTGTAVIIKGDDMNAGLAAALMHCANAGGATTLKTKLALAGDISRQINNHIRGNNSTPDCSYIYNENTHGGSSPPVANSIDPNEKTGPGQGSAGHFMAQAGYMSYDIGFENDSNATLPAQTVMVYDTLKAGQFDNSSFAFTSVTIGDSTFELPLPSAQFIHDFDFRSTMGVKARVIGSFNPLNGLVTWKFYSIDPVTNQITTDALAGFLPPNKIAPKGQGHVSFIVKSNSAIQSGDTIFNSAQIIFDKNPPINTNKWQNVFDLTKPVSAVNGLSATSGISFTLNWSGTDDYSGVKDYTIYVSDDESAYYPWMKTGNTSATFNGVDGHTYSFYSVATDSAGNVEAPPSTPDATTLIESVNPVKSTVFNLNISLFPWDPLESTCRHASLSIL